MSSRSRSKRSTFFIRDRARVESYLPFYRHFCDIFQVKGKEKKSEIRRRKITREGKMDEGKKRNKNGSIFSECFDRLY